MFNVPVVAVLTGLLLVALLLPLCAPPLPLPSSSFSHFPIGVCISEVEKEVEVGRLLIAVRSDRELNLFWYTGKGAYVLNLSVLSSDSNNIGEGSTFLRVELNTSCVSSVSGGVVELSVL